MSYSWSLWYLHTCNIWIHLDLKKFKSKTVTRNCFHSDKSCQGSTWNSEYPLTMKNQEGVERTFSNLLNPSCPSLLRNNPGNDAICWHYCFAALLGSRTKYYSNIHTNIQGNVLRGVMSFHSFLGIIQINYSCRLAVTSLRARTLQVS